MLISTRVMFVLAAMVVSSLPLCSAGTASCNSVENDMVPLLVKACVVEVDNKKLYEKAGREKLESVSLTRVLWALGQDYGAEIVNSLEIALIGGRTGKVFCEKKHSEEASGENDSKEEDINSEFESSFSADAVLLKSGKIALRFEFFQKSREQEFAVARKGRAANRNAVILRWIGGIVLEPGKPVLAGITDDGNATMILILMADIVK